MSDDDYGYLPEATDLGVRQGSECRLVLDQLALQTPTLAITVTGSTTMAVTWQDRRLLLTFVPDEAGGLTTQVRAFRDDDWTEITMDELGDVWLLHV